MIYKVNVNDIKQAFIEIGGEIRVREIQHYILDHKCNGLVPDNYSSFETYRSTIQRKIEDFCPQALDFKPQTQTALFKRVGHGLYKLINNDVYDELHIPEEVQEPKAIFEGATKEISVNIYERNPQARAICVQFHGYSCSVCGFNFRSTYGELGQNFIHVHHLKPLHLLAESYEIDPIQDLKPVCPNCHAMLHKKSPPYTIDELKQLLSFQ